MERNELLNILNHMSLTEKAVIDMSTTDMIRVLEGYVEMIANSPTIC